MNPDTRFAFAGDVAIAYKVYGGGGEADVPLVVLLPDSNVDVEWNDPDISDFFGRLREFCTVIRYDKRGTGLSDRRVDFPSLEERAEDVLAVLDAEDIHQATLFGVSEGGSLAAYVAATQPHRVRSIIIWGTPSRFIRDDGHPWGYVTRHQLERFIQSQIDGWGTPDWMKANVALWAPSKAADENFKRSYATWRLHSLSRDAVRAHIVSMMEYDLADVFPVVRVPTLLLHRTEDLVVPVEQGRRLAEIMPEARFVELSGKDHLPFVGDTHAVLAELHHFLTGERGAVPAQRRLVTLLMTDIAGSTAVADTMGDGPWRSLLSRFDDVVRQHIARFEGREVKQTGDGFLVTFDGPARAIQCAMAVAEAAERLGLEVHTGVHTGECEMIDDDIAGIAVHVASRLSAIAEGGQIIASATVSDLVAGSGIRFGDGVDVELEGLAGRRMVHEVVRRGATPSAVRRLEATKSATLERAGDYWTVAFDGRAVAVRHLAGLADLSALLERPGKELHVLDLASPDGRRRHFTVQTAVLDEHAKGEYRRRLTELETDLEEADTHNDVERAAQLAEERGLLVDELSAAYGLGGRGRTFNEEGERARKAVSKRLRVALDRIGELHPALGRHLESTIRTGVYCAYEPDPVVHWNVSV